MNRPSLPAAAALAAAGALLLTACGGGDDKTKDGDKIAGARDSKQQASPSASEAEESTDRPKIALPKDLKYVFNWPSTRNATEKAVLHDGEQFIKATDMALAEQDPLHKAYRFYSEGEAAAGTEVYVKRFVDHKARTTGTYRFFKGAVSVKGGKASLVYCEDQSKAFNRYIETDKVDETPVTKNSYVFYNTSMRKNDQGVWVTEKMLSQRGAAQCQP
ncbi:hypothetical protein ACFYYR_12750 [Streptomyces sp. NPDC001922]|uniref:hypothetical protein n=1 Tax=Streptomyces sp. NPDC001922 TaxID=3364624 RepID=UPI003682208A